MEAQGVVAVRGVCELIGEKKHRAWPSWMLARHMTGARDCGVR